MSSETGYLMVKNMLAERSGGESEVKKSVYSQG